MSTKRVFLSGFLILLFGLFIMVILQVSSFNKEPLKIGILHSFTGTMAASERPVAEAELLAIDEINAQGGLLGRKIQAIVSDGKSDSLFVAREAERLIKEERVNAIFGCWTSDCRKTVKPVIEAHDHLLFYPVQYEGLEKSRNIVYLGAAPNQQIIPAVKWSFDNLGKRFFLVGSDYIFPRTSNEIIKDVLRGLDAEVVGEEYLTLASVDVESVVRKIAELKPDVVLNTLNGSTNIPFFKALKQSGVLSQGVHVMSFSIAENEVLEIGPELLEGQYAAWNYFQSIQRLSNSSFVSNFKKKYGETRVLSDPMEAGYIGIYLWAQAVEEAGTADPQIVRRVLLKDQSLAAPEGIVSVDPETQHLWKGFRIGRIRPDGQFDILWTSAKEIAPVPYPVWRSEEEWNQYLDQMFEQWGRRWAKDSD